MTPRQPVQQSAAADVETITARLAGAPKESWWIGLTREAFRERLSKEDGRMRLKPSGAKAEGGV